MRRRGNMIVMSKVMKAIVLVDSRQLFSLRTNKDLWSRLQDLQKA